MDPLGMYESVSGNPRPQKSKIQTSKESCSYASQKDQANESIVVSEVDEELANSSLETSRMIQRIRDSFIEVKSVCESFDMSPLPNDGTFHNTDIISPHDPCKEIEVSEVLDDQEEDSPSLDSNLFETFHSLSEILIKMHQSLHNSLELRETVVTSFSLLSQLHRRLEKLLTESLYENISNNMTIKLLHQEIIELKIKDAQLRSEIQDLIIHNRVLREELTARNRRRRFSTGQFDRIPKEILIQSHSTTTRIIPLLSNIDDEDDTDILDLENNKSNERTSSFSDYEQQAPSEPPQKTTGTDPNSGHQRREVVFTPCIHCGCLGNCEYTESSLNADNYKNNITTTNGTSDYAEFVSKYLLMLAGLMCAVLLSDFPNALRRLIYKDYLYIFTWLIEQLQAYCTIFFEWQQGLYNKFYEFIYTSQSDLL